MPEEKSSQKPPREPQALSSEYHKARKQLMLWAGILFIWELVGVDLEKAKESGGNAGAIITAIKSPQAVPWVLLILVLYFLFKMTVEWYQCNPNRRALRVSRIDLFSGWIASLLAVVLYVGQTLGRAQLADYIQKNPSYVKSSAFGFTLGLVVIVLILAFRESQKTRDKIPKVAFLLMIGGVTVAMVGLYRGGWVNGRMILFSFLISIPFGLLFWFLTRRFRHPLRGQ